MRYFYEQIFKFYISKIVFIWFLLFGCFGGFFWLVVCFFFFVFLLLWLCEYMCAFKELFSRDLESDN